MINAEEILGRVGSLPPLPDTALKLMQVVNDPLCDLDAIVEAIRYDPSVTAEMLRICNSAYSGLTRKVTSLSDAMVCLGTAKVLQLVMSVHAGSMLSREQVGYGLPPGMLWKHAVGVALSASHFAKQMKLPNANLAYTAGLLHDIGKIILNEYVAAEFVEIVERVRDEGVPFAEAEQQVLGFSHEDIGGMIGEAWNLPESIVQCIRFHHNPGALEPTDPLVDAVYLANCLCLMLGVGLGEDGLCSRADATVLDRHDLTEHDLELIGVNTLTELHRVEELFAVTHTASPCNESVVR